MPEDRTPTDLLQRTRDTFAAFSGGEIEAGLSCIAPDATYASAELGTSFEGVEAIRLLCQSAGTCPHAGGTCVAGLLITYESG